MAVAVIYFHSLAPTVLHLLRPIQVKLLLNLIGASCRETSMILTPALTMLDGRLVKY